MNIFYKAFLFIIYYIIHSIIIARIKYLNCEESYIDFMSLV